MFIQFCKMDVLFNDFFENRFIFLTTYNFFLDYFMSY